MIGVVVVESALDNVSMNVIIDKSVVNKCSGVDIVLSCGEATVGVDDVENAFKSGGCVDGKCDFVR